jgi:hypothetical protein
MAIVAQPHLDQKLGISLRIIIVSSDSSRFGTPCRGNAPIDNLFYDDVNGAHDEFPLRAVADSHLRIGFTLFKNSEHNMRASPARGDRAGY